MASKKMNKADLDKLKEAMGTAAEEIEINTVDTAEETQIEIEVEEDTEEAVETKIESENIKVEEKEPVKEEKIEVKEEKPKRKRNSQANKALEMELEKQKEIAGEYQDKYQRLLAEFENARSRTEKESMRMFDVGAKDVLEKLLPVVDNFERAIDFIPEEDMDRAFEQGIGKIYKQLMVSLEDMGVVPMNAEGTEFNPDLHNAVMHIEDEELGENIVAEEMQKGYIYKDSVLRYSMVKVAN